MDLAARSALEARWLDLTRRVLPGLAAERNWPIRADHCFQRVLLDATFCDVWYAHVEGRPAYRIIPDAALARAADLASRVAAGDVSLPELNRASLAFRAQSKSSVTN